MTGIHSVFSNTKRGFIYNMDGELSISELYTWVYSIMTWKRDGHPIYLYCDDKINEFVVKYGFDYLYDEIRVRDYNDNIHECFWSYNKIRVIEEFDGPVCIFDVDTFFRDTEFTKSHFDMACYHYERWSLDNINKFYNDKEEFKGLSFYENIDDEFKVVNGSLLVFNSHDLKTEFLKNIKEVVETITEITYKDSFEYDSYTIFMEQFVLGYMVKKYHCDTVSQEEGQSGKFHFNSKESFAHLGKDKHRLKYGNPLRKVFYNQVIKEKIIELGYSEYSKLFTLTMEVTENDTNSLIPKREKPLARLSGDKITIEVLNKWYDSKIDFIRDSDFNVVVHGSTMGNDIDLVVSKKGKSTIKELESFMLELHRSGDTLGINIEPLYVSDMEYFREFKMTNSRKVMDNILIGFVSEQMYEPIGELKTFGKLKFRYGPFNNAFYESTNKHDEVLFIDSVNDIKNNNGYTHFSSEVYNTIYERFGIFTMLG